MFPHMYKARPGKIQQARAHFEPAPPEQNKSTKPGPQSSTSKPASQKTQEQKSTADQKPPLQKQVTTQKPPSSLQKQPSLQKETPIQKNLQKQLPLQKEPSNSKPTVQKQPSLQKEPSNSKPSFQKQPSFQKEPANSGPSVQKLPSQNATAEPSTPKTPFQRQTSSQRPLFKQKSLQSPGMTTECESQQDGWRKNPPWNRQNSTEAASPAPDSPGPQTSVPSQDNLSKKSSFILKEPQKDDNASWRKRTRNVPNSPEPKSTKEPFSVQLRKVSQPEDKSEPDSPPTKVEKNPFAVSLKKVQTKSKPEPASPKTPPAKDVFKIPLKKIPTAPEKTDSKRRPASWCEEVQLKPIPEQKKKSVRISEEEPTEEAFPRRLSLRKMSEDGGAPPPPPLPPGPPGAPPPPPPPPAFGKKPKVDKKSSEARKVLVDQIKKASRTRPDWMSVMKDLEGGVKLKRVKTEDKLDRSSPILPQNRGKEGTFVYDSERADPRFNMMLKEIQHGIKLRHVKTNDRSRPDFNRLGMRKLKRQRTCSEMKSIPPDAPEALPSSSDDEDDIDRMRDDLKSTNNQLADEIKKSKQMETQNKILKIDIESLQVEVKKLKRQLKEAGVHETKAIKKIGADAMAPKLSKSMSKLRMREEELDFSELDVIDEEIDTLKEQIDAQQRRAEKAEQKVDELNQKLKVCNNSSDEWELRSIYYEKKHKALQKEQSIELPDISCIGIQTDPIEISPQSPGTTGPARKSGSRKSLSSIFTRMESFKEEDEDESESSSSEEESEESEEETEDDEEGEEEEEELEEGEEEGTPVIDEAAAAKRASENETKRKERDLKTWKSKLNQAKEKERNLKHDRIILRDKISKLYGDMRKERQEYLRVKEELTEMADALKEANESEDEEEEEEEESEEEEEEEEEGEEDENASKSSRSKNGKQQEEDDEEKEDELPNLDSPKWDSSEEEEDSELDEDIEKAIPTLQRLTKKHEEIVIALRKGNSTLKTKADRCNEMFGEERRRHARLDNELQMLLAAIE